MEMYNTTVKLKYNSRPSADYQRLFSSIGITLTFWKSIPRTQRPSSVQFDKDAEKAREAIKSSKALLDSSSKVLSEVRASEKSMGHAIN